MRNIERTAKVEWQGGLDSGSGRVERPGSEELLSWNGRIAAEPAAAPTSPEELIAAAHAACFSMALTHVLEQDGSVPDRLNVDATCTLETESMTISSVHLVVRVAADMDSSRFDDLVRRAEASCPVSNALRGNVDITVDAALAKS
jgi:osmotically inducible protein OsmC